MSYFTVTQGCIIHIKIYSKLLRIMWPEGFFKIFYWNFGWVSIIAEKFCSSVTEIVQSDCCIMDVPCDLEHPMRGLYLSITTLGLNLMMTFAPVHFEIQKRRLQSQKIYRVVEKNFLFKLAACFCESERKNHCCCCCCWSSSFGILAGANMRPA